MSNPFDLMNDPTECPPIEIDFRLVKTPWGDQYLHKSNLVWCSYYPSVEIRAGFLQKYKLIRRGTWKAYYTTKDYVGEKPWCNSNWAIDPGDGVATMQEAMALCVTKFLNMRGYAL
jgi:hypothetical protein